MDPQELGAKVLPVRVGHVQRLDVKKRVEYRMAQFEVLDVRTRQHTQDLLLEVVPLVQHEVVDDQEPALLQVRSEAEHLTLAWNPEARLEEIGEWVHPQLRVSHCEVDTTGSSR